LKLDDRRITYTEVGDDGIDVGDRDPTLRHRCCEGLAESLRSRIESFCGVRAPVGMMWRSSFGEEGWEVVIKGDTASKGMR
jgi:hypothetical protein